MSFFTSATDIISANLNDLVRGCARPDAVLTQLIQEIQASIQKTQSEIDDSVASISTLTTELNKNEDQVYLWQTRAEAAVAAGDDRLARVALIHRQEFESIAAALRDEHTTATESNERDQRRIKALQAKLAQAQRALRDVLSRTRKPDLPGAIVDVDAPMAGVKQDGQVDLEPSDTSSKSKADAPSAPPCSRKDNRSAVSEDLESAIRTELLRLKNKIRSVIGGP